ncbi:MAG TPA: ABC transporter permease [Chromatiales bacterium]|nr:ABC transporter permease [Thiotrichales bacterium]HIP67256.1 ABC transporter permease [Chromatiales bacterium]
MFAAILKKELLLVTRDIHALAVLFIMPMTFILIMSLSLKNTMEQETDNKPEIGLWLEDSGHQLKSKLENIKGFQVASFQEIETIKESAKNDEINAAILIPKNINSAEQPQLEIYYAPSTPPQLRQLILASISQVLTAEKLQQLLKKVPQTRNPEDTQDTKLSELISVHELFKSKGKTKQPTSVQQSVPAWLIFSMFFVVIPIATTFLIEKQQGTLQRLKTYPIPGSFLLIGKLIPYLGINLIQTLLMFLVGIYLVPLLGGDALQLPENPWLLIPISMAISVTAISFALLVATLVKTTEQATTIGGISNLLLAAIGGIMVPIFIMPDFMQSVAKFSPMNWGLEGYLDILLRQGTLENILPEIGKLLLLATGLFGLALFFYGRRTAT